MNNYDYPLGADLKKAPWNLEDDILKEVEVTVSITLSKTVKVKVADYITEKDVDEDGNHYTNYDFSGCDLESAVRNQIKLPNKIEEFKDWFEDDLEVILE